MTESAQEKARDLPGEDGFGPWNPGIKSQLPLSLLPRVTIFHPDNALISAEEARELADFTGQDLFDHATLRPERLAIHELLVRITANFSVPDGPNYEDLGISFRKIARTILSPYIDGHRDELHRIYDGLEDRTRRFVFDELTRTLFAPPDDPGPPPKQKFWTGLFGGNGRQAERPVTAATDDPATDNREAALAQWRADAEAADDDMEQCALLNLVKTVTAVSSRHGHVPVNKELLVSLVANRVCNDLGSRLIGQAIDPLIEAAVEKEDFRLLPRQERPVVMNIKGASASGKSTMRPLQHRLAEEIGTAWQDYAVITPDIWRKFLLDYDSLGDDYKYAGTLTGHEVAIIDQKLDRYMAEKAQRGAMSHLLIDRFRFDSFTSDPDAEEGGNLMTRFGDEIYMFFMITPPEATVERAWYRGLEFGRYKTVDDLLHHNVEAFTGMPRLFFTWARRTDKTVHYEFLDNSVPEGQKPRTVAFGRNDDMTILDIKKLLDINRYQKINIDAQNPDAVYPEADLLAAESNMTFLKQCSQRIAAITFADQRTGRPYARMENGRVVWTDSELYRAALTDEDVKAVMAMLDPEDDGLSIPPETRPPPDISHATHTLGAWGTGD